MQWTPRSILRRLVMLGGDFETAPGDAVDIEKWPNFGMYEYQVGVKIM